MRKCVLYEALPAGVYINTFKLSCISDSIHDPSPAISMMNGSSAYAQQRFPIELVQNFVQVYPVDQWRQEGFFEDDHLLDIDCHWMTVEPTRLTVQFLLVVICVIVFLIGSLSNTLAIYIIVRSRKLFNPANILLANLAISDLVIILTTYMLLKVLINDE